MPVPGRTTVKMNRIQHSDRGANVCVLAFFAMVIECFLFLSKTAVKINVNKIHQVEKQKFLQITLGKKKKHNHKCSLWSEQVIIDY